MIILEPLPNPDELMLTFDLHYSEARTLPDGTSLITLDKFPFDVINVAKLPCWQQRELKLIVRRSTVIEHCSIFVTPTHFLMRDSERWLYSFRKNVLHKAHRRTK